MRPQAVSSPFATRHQRRGKRSRPQHLWGLGLRHHHFDDLEARLLRAPDAATLEARPAIECLEVLSDNLLFHRGGPALGRTLQLAAASPVVLHGVGLNIASADPIDIAYVRELGDLASKLGARHVSDHLCLTRSGGHSSFELLPFPRHDRYMNHIATRVQQVQDLLGQSLLLENVSAYVGFSSHEVGEAAFFQELVARTGCRVLLDVNNLHVNAFNFGGDAWSELSAFPWHAVAQLHVAGYTDRGEFLFDTHDQPATAPVLQLLKAAIHHWQAAHAPDTQSAQDATLPIVLEWDDAKTPFAVVEQELDRLRAYVEEVQEIDVHA